MHSVLQTALSTGHGTGQSVALTPADQCCSTMTPSGSGTRLSRPALLTSWRPVTRLVIETNLFEAGFLNWFVLLSAEKFSRGTFAGRAFRKMKARRAGAERRFLALACQAPREALQCGLQFGLQALRQFRDRARQVRKRVMGIENASSFAQIETKTAAIRLRTCPGKKALGHKALHGLRCRATCRGVVIGKR